MISHTLGLRLIMINRKVLYQLIQKLRSSATLCEKTLNVNLFRGFLLTNLFIILLDIWLLIIILNTF